MRITISALAVAIALAGCEQAAKPAGNPIAELRAADSALQEALVAKDLEKITAFYADNAVMLPTAEPMIEGKPAIRDEWQHILAIPDFSNAAQLRGADVSTAGDLGYTWGTYRSKMMGEDGKPVEEPGKFLTVWKRGADGGWKVVMDTYNTDVPPPDHK